MVGILLVSVCISQPVFNLETRGAQWVCLTYGGDTPKIEEQFLLLLFFHHVDAPKYHHLRL